MGPRLQRRNRHASCLGRRHHPLPWRSPMRRALACSVLSLVAACGGAKLPVDESFADLAGLDEKADSFSYRMKILGALGYGENSLEIGYTQQPRFRAYRFAGRAGDKVEARVRSSDGGDAVAWILDARFEVVAHNDDA